MPRTPQPFAGQDAPGQPFVSHDAASVSDIVLVDTVDTHAPDYVRKDYGAAYPGFVDQQLQTTLFQGYPLIDEEAIDQNHLRRYWQFLPGSWVANIEFNPQSLALNVERKRKNVGANIKVGEEIFAGSGATATTTLTGGVPNTPNITAGGTKYGPYVGITWTASPTGDTTMGYGITTAGVLTSIVVSNVGSGYVSNPTITVLPKTFVNTSNQGINTYISYEVQTIETDSPYNSLATALQSTDIISYQFPSRLDVAFLEATGLFQTAYIRSGARRVPAKIYTYYVISDTMPALPYDPIIFQPQISVMKPDGSFIDLGDYDNVLIDANSQTYQAFDSSTVTVNYPDSTPSFTVYQGTWLGTDKHVDGGVEMVKYGKVWKIRVVDVTMR